MNRDLYTLATWLMWLALPLTAFTWRAGQPKAAWPLMVMFYLILTGLWLVNNWIAQRNLNAQSSPSATLCTQFPHGYESENLAVLQLHS